MHYYKINGQPCFSTEEIDNFEAASEKECKSIMEKDNGLSLNYLRVASERGRTSLAVSDVDVLFENVDNLEIIRSGKQSRENAVIPEWITTYIKQGRVRYLNIMRPNFRRIFSLPRGDRWRINIVGLGDVGTNLLIGLKLLGGEYISEIGVYSVKENVMKRCEMELNQIFSIDEDSILNSERPRIKTLKKEQLMDCDMFIFCASSKVPEIGARVEDVRSIQYESNREILTKYVRKTRESGFEGIFAIVSDPVEMLCKAAYEISNTDAKGNWDGKGLLPEQIQGFGLGVMYARALYYANRDSNAENFKTNGRAYGMHGNGLVICNDIYNYDDELSIQLTDKTIHANLMVRELGFKPYIAPALSSGAISILERIAGKYNYSSIFIDGTYLGIKNRFTCAGLDIERLPLPDPLFKRIEKTHQYLKAQSVL